MQSPFALGDYLARHPPKNGRFHTVAIDGRGGSGKTALAAYLQGRYPSVVLLNGDDYFEPNWDSLVRGAHDEARFTADVIEPLKHGNHVMPRRYDWTARRWAEPHVVDVQDIFCLERCFSFESGLDWDVRIWVEVPRGEAFARAIGRDTAEAGPRWAAALVEIWTAWQLREDTYIARVRPLELATVIVDGGRRFEGQIV